MRRLLLAPLFAGTFVLVAGPVAAARGEDPLESGNVERVEVTVTAVSGGSVYVDNGRQAHIEPGDLLRLYPAGGETVDARISSVSFTSARAELPDAAPVVDVGDRGEVFVLADRLPSEEDEPGVDDAAAPEHPPWTQPPEEWNDQTPLLAPAFGLPQEQRPVLVHGRFFASLMANYDDEHDQSFTLLRMGSDVTVDNPLHVGGQLHIDGEFFRRAARVDVGDDESTSRGRLDRFSYRRGGTRDQPNRFEVGRFLQDAVPEFGVLDGVEFQHRTEQGAVAGASVGSMPGWTPAMTTGEDYQLAGFFRAADAEPTGLDWLVAYQNTWHKGIPDRNLLLGTFDFHPEGALRVLGGVWIDYYGPSEEIKSSGFELTEARLQGSLALNERSGLGFHASRLRWPEQQRDDFGTIAPGQLARYRVMRMGVSGYHRFEQKARVEGSYSQWHDRDDSGFSSDARVTLDDVFGEHSDLALSIFATEGSFTDRRGFRVAARRRFGGGRYGSLQWELDRDDQGSVGGGLPVLKRHTVRASYHTVLGERWNLSWYAESRFGEAQDAFNLGVFMQTRF